MSQVAVYGGGGGGGGGGGISAITSLTTADSAYTVLTADQYLSCDVSGGPLTILLPDAPATTRIIYIKDATGFAFTNNITVTTVSGITLIDTNPIFIMNDNFQAISVVFNTTSLAYEVF